MEGETSPVDWFSHVTWSLLTSVKAETPQFLPVDCKKNQRLKEQKSLCVNLRPRLRCVMFYMFVRWPSARRRFAAVYHPET